MAWLSRKSHAHKLHVAHTKGSKCVHQPIHSLLMKIAMYIKRSIFFGQWEADGWRESIAPPLYTYTNTQMQGNSLSMKWGCCLWCRCFVVLANQDEVIIQNYVYMYMYVRTQWFKLENVCKHSFHVLYTHVCTLCICIMKTNIKM